MAPIMKLGEVPTQQLVASVVFPKMEEKELDLDALSICGASIAGTTASVDTSVPEKQTSAVALSYATVQCEDCGSIVSKERVSQQCVQLGGIRAVCQLDV